MCGICGIVSTENLSPNSRSKIAAMSDSLFHRGPDEDGYYADLHAALGIQRLSILDLETGQQPISNEDGSIRLVFNGEIYNYRELRRQLQQAGHVFTSRSDSEVIVHAYEEFGPGCLERLNGIFAFAIWDKQARQLMLARDRLGVKPLYYWHNNDRIVFASELKALLRCPDVPCQVDAVALDHYLTLEYIPSPRSMVEGVRKVPPGHFVTFASGQCRLNLYWDVPAQETTLDEASCRERLIELLNESVRIQLVSDVPLGAFLSGGIDSSTILSFMSANMNEAPRTFSIGFEDSSYNELADARAVASHFGTRHEDVVMRPDITGLAEKLLFHLDEPLADFSIFPTFLVSSLASRSVKVVLSGDGGDELFAGYDTYVAQRLDRLYQRLPPGIRQRTLPGLLGRIPPQSQKKGIINKTKRFVQGAAMPAALQHTRWMIFLDAAEKQQLYEPSLSARVNGDQGADWLLGVFQQARQRDPLAQQQYVDIKTYLADNILAKVDRMSMAASIEARVPLLDHRLVEFVLNLPPQLKLHRGQTKVILRQAMRDRLPPAVLTKPKQGFSIPIKTWLRGPLREMMGDLLSPDTVRRRGYFQTDTINNWMSEHLDGRANHSHRLWALMVFEAWLQTEENR